MTDSQGNNFGNLPPNSALESGRALRSTLAAALADTLSSRKLSQIDAARICAADQPTISKVLRGVNVGVTVDKLFCWLAALGCNIEVHVNKARDLKSGDVRAVFHD